MAKRKPPRPKSTANLPPGLAAYWAKRGVPATAGGSSKSSSKTTSKRKSSSKKRSTRKRSSKK